MTDRTVLALRPDVLARALWNVSDLMLAQRVDFDGDFSRGVTDSRAAVVVRVTGYPVERDELIAALGDPEPYDWTGESGRRHRDWRGELLTMHLIVTETLPEPSAVVEPEPPASDPAGDVEQRPEEEFVPSPSPVPSCPGVLADAEARCGEPGPHGAHPLGDEPPAVVIRPASPDDAAAAIAAGLVPAGAEHYTDPATAAAWHRYAIGRARSAFKGDTFTTPAAAMRALDAWAGRRMLNEGDVAQLAGELLAIPPVPARSWPRPYVRWPLVRRTRARHGLLVGIGDQGPVS